MKIHTSLELVRYIRHHLAGSEFQDVKAVEDFVDEKLKAQSEQIKLYNELLLAVENKYPNESRHQTALRLIKQAQARFEVHSSQTGRITTDIPFGDEQEADQYWERKHASELPKETELLNMLKEVLPTLRYSIDEGTQAWRREVRQNIYDRAVKVVEKYDT